MLGNYYLLLWDSVGFIGEVSMGNLGLSVVHCDGILSIIKFQVAAVEVNNSCKSAAAHNIFTHEYTIQDIKQKRNKTKA